MLFRTSLVQTWQPPLQDEFCRCRCQNFLFIVFAIATTHTFVQKCICHGLAVSFNVTLALTWKITILITFSLCLLLCTFVHGATRDPPQNGQQTPNTETCQQDQHRVRGHQCESHQDTWRSPWDAVCAWRHRRTRR